MKVVIKVRTEETKRAADGRARHVDERAIALASIEIDDFLKLVE